MKVSAILFAATGFGIGMFVVPSGAAERDQRVATTEVALASTDAGGSDETANCRVPGEIRSFGSVTMVTPRRLVTLDSADCLARGGEVISATAASAD